MKALGAWCVTLLFVLSAVPATAQVNVSQLGENGWYSDDTRADGSGTQPAGTNLISPTLTDAPEGTSGAATSAHDADILGQILFGEPPVAPPVGTHPAAVQLFIDAVGGAAGKSQISHRKDDATGFGSGDLLFDPSFSVDYSWFGNGVSTVSASFKLGIRTSESASSSPRTGENVWDKVLIYEPGDGNGNTSDGATWYQESITSTQGKWWFFDRTNFESSQSYNMTLDDMRTSSQSIGSRTIADVAALINDPSAVITSIQFGIGSNNPGGNVFVNQLETSFYSSGNVVTFGTLPVTNVTQGTSYGTIQGAIDAANPNDTISVAPGTYQEFLDVDTPVTLIGAGSGATIVDVSPFTSERQGLDINVDDVTVQGITFDGGSNGSWPRYGLDASGNDNLQFVDVVMQGMDSSGFNMNGVTNSVLTDCQALGNGGAGIFMTDNKNIAFTNLTTSNNAWGAVGVATWGRFHPIGSTGIVFTGVNSFGEANGDNLQGLYFEEGNFFDKANPERISFSFDPGDGADVTFGPGDFTWALYGPQDDGDPVTSSGYDRIRFYGNQADAEAAAQAPYDGTNVNHPGHLLDQGRYLVNLTASGAAYEVTPCASCVTVPIDIGRIDAGQTRGISVTLDISDDLAVCGSGIAAATGPGSWLDGLSAGEYTVQTINNPDGTLTIDIAVFGASCGPAGGGTAVEVPVASNLGGTSGTGTIEVVGVDIRDCSFQPVAGVAPPAATVEIDETAPPAIADLAVAQVTSGNDTDGTTQVALSWTASPDPDAATIEIYRKGFGDYPEYDDGTGTAPTTPADPAAAVADNWTLVASVPATGTGYTDEPSTRDFWSYVVFVSDGCNISPVSNAPDGALNYHLGDISSSGDNAVDTQDISALASAYGTSEGDASYDAFADVGPTTDFTPSSRPTTDNQIQFEDLLMFAANYGVVSKSTSPAPVAVNDVTLHVPTVPSETGEITVSIQVAGDASLRGLSVPVEWDASAAEFLGWSAGDLMARQGGLAPVYSAEPGRIDAAVFGDRPGIAGEGTMAVLRFRVKPDTNPAFALGSIDARDFDNEQITIDGTVVRGVTGNAPTALRTELRPNVPNPFNPRTTIHFVVGQEGPVKVRVFDVSGRLVRTLVDETMNAGAKAIDWDGTDDSGRQVSSGTYLMRLSTVDAQQSRTMLLVK